MTFAKLTAVQAAIINNARSVADKETRQAIKRDVFAAVKAKFGISDSVLLSCQTEATQKDDYLAVKVGKKNRDYAGYIFPLDVNDKWSGDFANVSALSTPAVPVDPRRWFRVPVQQLIDTYKEAEFLGSEAAIDLPAEAVLSPTRDDFAALGADVFIKATPDQ